jgi:lipopolysaccharide export system permease protein
MDLKEGVFYDKIDGYVIKLGKKESNDSVMHNIIIFEKRYGLQDNMTMAESGIMRVSPDKKFLEFTMFNGWRYQERGQRGNTPTEFTRLYFKEYKKVFDLKSFQLGKNNDQIYDPKMLSIRQLQHALDSVKNNDVYYLRKSKAELGAYLRFMAYKDSAKLFDRIQAKPIKSMDDIIPPQEKSSNIENVGYQFTSMISSLESLSIIYKEKLQSTAYHAIEWHRKFTLSFACIVLFLIGAPLGSIIRKGGLGTPMVLAVAFFVVFFLLNNFGEKLAKSGTWDPYAGMWLSSFLLIPIGIFLTYKAMRDSQLFNQEFYYRTLQPIKVTLKKYFKK